MPEIQYLGHACFRVRGREGIVVCDPFDRSTGLELGRLTAHIVTVSHSHSDHANTAAVKPVRERLFVATGPGEYEVGGILIHGVRTFHDSEHGARLGHNTVYVIRIDDVVFCHLGDLGHELTQSQIEEIGSIDVLFVPVGGGETIGPAEAASVISQLEPRIAIPMHFAASMHQLFEQPLQPLEKFLHEVGLKDVALEEKLSVNPGSLSDDEETRIIPMRPAA